MCYRAYTRRTHTAPPLLLAVQARDLATQADLFIDGKPVKSEATSTVQVHDPATQRVVNELPETTAAEFERAVNSSAAAFPAWAATPVPARQRVMFRFLELIKQHKDELAHAVTLEQGKTLGDAHGDVFRGLEVRLLPLTSHTCACRGC